MGYFVYRENESPMKGLKIYLSNDVVTLNSYSVNLELSKKLLSVKSNKRTIRVSQFLQDIIYKLPDEVIIKDIDVLFNPLYEIDILKILTDLYKNKNFSVLWPGSFNDEYLTYSIEGYKDYKSYKVIDYDIICIK